MTDSSDRSIAYARETMLPAREPPVSQRGIVRWMRENLFSSPMNTILTLLGLGLIFLTIRAALPWFINGVWNANSLAECRAIIAERAGPDASGACWAMIRERWHQFIFGFYPPELWWRPILAFGLLFVAIGRCSMPGRSAS